MINYQMGEMSPPNKHLLIRNAFGQCFRGLIIQKIPFGRVWIFAVIILLIQGLGLHLGAQQSDPQLTSRPKPPNYLDKDHKRYYIKIYGGLILGVISNGQAANRYCDPTAAEWLNAGTFKWDAETNLGWKGGSGGAGTYLAWGAVDNAFFNRAGTKIANAARTVPVGSISFESQGGGQPTNINGVAGVSNDIIDLSGSINFIQGGNNHRQVQRNCCFHFYTRGEQYS